VSLQRFGYIGSVDLDDLFVTYDMNVRVAVQVVQAVLPGMTRTGQISTTDSRRSTSSPR
jgi:3-oxoacyl-[acyl-carrier protein] reductase